jgi:hypothetical protein
LSADAREKERSPQFDPAIITHILEAVAKVKADSPPAPDQACLLDYVKQIAENTGHLADVSPALKQQSEEAARHHAATESLSEEMAELKETVAEQIPATIRHYKVKAEMTDKETKRHALAILNSLAADDATPKQKVRMIEAFHLRVAGKTIDEIARKLGIQKSQVSGLYKDIERLTGLPFTGRKIARGAHDGTHYRKNGARRDITHRPPSADDPMYDEK